MSIYKTIMNLAGMHEGSPPAAPTLRTGAADCTTVWANLNDGHELWVGWPNRWKHHVPHDEVRALFWWLLWRYYGQARWFGLRRPIYYWALRRYITAATRRNGGDPTC